ncbi:MAG: tRNA dihydrouridine synthase DusB [Halieaceae bacterium]
MLAIGPYKLDNPVALAPMAGVTDLPFRRLCRRLGAGLVVSEMVSSDTSLWGSRKTRLRLQHGEECEPRSVQIAGSEPEAMANAAACNVAQGAQIIDINMGCPAKKVCRKAAGSALLQDEALVGDILRAVVAAVDVPVTLKIRTGWSPQQRNGVSIARLAEDSGIAALAVHGRTRACKFNGEAEYQTIADICRAVSIPVFANGDIDSPAKALAVMQASGAAGVMVGRAAQGRPWLCGQIARYLQDGSVQPEPGAELQWNILLEHLNGLYEFYGEYAGLRIARKHVGWYLQGSQHGDSFRRNFNQLESAQAQRSALETFFSHYRYKELAA